MALVSVPDSLLATNQSTANYATHAGVFYVEETKSSTRPFGGSDGSGLRNEPVAQFSPSMAWHGIECVHLQADPGAI